MSMEKAVREKQISMMAKLYYVRCPFLQKEPLDDWIKDNMDKYLESNLSIEEINDSIADTIREKKNDKEKELNSMMNEKKDNSHEKKTKKKVLGDNDEGFISNMIITTLALITFALCSIGLVLLYFMNS